MCSSTRLAPLTRQDLYYRNRPRKSSQVDTPKQHMSLLHVLLEQAWQIVVKYVGTYKRKILPSAWVHKAYVTNP